MSADPSLLKLVPVDSSAIVSIKGVLTHRCPFVEEVDAGTINISWRCEQMTVELHSLAAYLGSWSGQAISSEEITEQIMRDLEALDGIESVFVSTIWQTAGMTVQISA